MKNYNINELYLVAVVKITKDFMDKKNDLNDCFEKVGFAICTKSLIIPNAFVDVYTKDIYNKLSPESKIGEYIFLVFNPLLKMCDGMSKEEAEVIKTTTFDEYVLADLLRFANKNYPKFAQARLEPKKENEEENEEEIDISKMS